MLFVVMFGHDGCYYAVTTTDSRQVLDILRRRPCDVTLLDMSMPTISGLEALRQITLACEAFPVIITGHGSIETAVEPYKLEQEVSSGHSFPTRVYLSTLWSIESIV